MRSGLPNACSGRFTMTRLRGATMLWLPNDFILGYSLLARLRSALLTGTRWKSDGPAESIECLCRSFEESLRKLCMRCHADVDRVRLVRIQRHACQVLQSHITIAIDQGVSSPSRQIFCIARISRHQIASRIDSDLAQRLRHPHEFRTIQSC